MPIFYLSPAGIDDFGTRPTAAAFKQKWHDYIADGDGDGFEGIAGRASENGFFYDAQNDPVPAGAPTPVPWNGFPRSITQWFNGDSDPAGLTRAIAAADVLRPLGRVQRDDTGESFLLLHRQQDEYCEWHADRSPTGAITRISFTAEGPEYWEKMAEADPELVLELYRKHISPAVQRADLFWPADMVASGQVFFERGTYNRWNKWNTQLGAMHLTHPANTLGAEINLAADATRLFPSVAATPAQSLPTRLICCAAFGGVNRSSDPLIGAGVNGFAREGKSVTLANPVGLYISEVGIDGLRHNNLPVGAQCLSVPRASADGSMKLRAEIAPPADAGFTLDQCKFEGADLRHGGQIARRITMVLFGIAKVIAGRQGQVRACRAQCCAKPDAPNFRLAIDPPPKQCSSIQQADWDEEAPLETAVIAAVDEEVEVPEDGLKKAKSSSRAR